MKKAITTARFLATLALIAARSPGATHLNEQLDAAIDELAALRTQISRVGNNLNQIDYVYNVGGTPFPDELQRGLAMLKHSLAQIDRAADRLVRRRI
ncbi:hypothetical protein [Streptomyces sp. NBRC 109706]|uniref:hypothetical protein n=1 Tax=Streptomyces sp. NBRC 109706 TaxID=1550035 RepID=UPI00082EEBE6|nr:hypothetical protein [Streptomyces sp. NBRC 109706]